MSTTNTETVYAEIQCQQQPTRDTNDPSGIVYTKFPGYSYIAKTKQNSDTGEWKNFAEGPYSGLRRNETTGELFTIAGTTAGLEEGAGLSFWGGATENDKAAPVLVAGKTKGWLTQPVGRDSEDTTTG